MKKIIILSGDPNSINSEIISKTWKKINSGLRKKIYLIANFKLILNQFKKINANIQIIKVNNINDIPVSNKLKIIDIPLNFKNPLLSRDNFWSLKYRLLISRLSVL